MAKKKDEKPAGASDTETDKAAETETSTGAAETSEDTIAQGEPDTVAETGDARVTGPTASDTDSLSTEDTLGRVDEAAPAQAEADPLLMEDGSSDNQSDIDTIADASATDRDDIMPSADADDTIVGSDTLEAEAAAPGETPSEPQVIRETVVERKGGFLPMLLGGLVAAAIGFALALFFGDGLLPGSDVDPFQDETRASLSDASQRIDALETEIADTRQAIPDIDLSGVEGGIAGLEDRLDQVASTVTGLQDTVAAFESRLTAIEKEPLAAAVSPEAIAAYERELDELRTAVTEQREAVDQQRAEIEAMAQQALASEQQAVEQADLAASRAAIADLTAAAADGAPYAEPLSDLRANGVSVPEILSENAEEGLPTLNALTEAFPELARDALGVARRAEAAEGGGGALGTFLQNQLGARSVTPRAGDDADAVLSRAEAALRDGEIEAALAEIDKLPEDAQAVLADWADAARTRVRALDAAQSLAGELN